MESEKRHKKPYLELLRVIAIFGVVFCHTESAGIHHYVMTSNPVNYWISIFLASVCQYCIPLFFMISGAVLLNREESISYVYKHRVIRIGLITVLMGLMQYLWIYRGHWETMTLKGAVRLLYEGDTVAPLWFLFAYLSFLMALPFLQRFVRAITDERWFFYLLILYTFCNDFLAIPEYYLGWNHTMLNLPILEYPVLMTVMGYFVEHRSGDMFLKARNIAAMIGISGGMTLLSMFVNQSALEGANYITMGNLFAPVYAMTIFVTVRYLVYKHPMPAALERAVCFAGAGAFVTYLTEIQLRDFFYPVYEFLGPRIHAIPAAFVWTGVCVLTGVLLAGILRRIPVVRKLI